MKFHSDFRVASYKEASSKIIYITSSRPKAREQNLVSGISTEYATNTAGSTNSAFLPSSVTNHEFDLSSASVKRWPQLLSHKAAH